MPKLSLRISRRNMLDPPPGGGVFPFFKTVFKSKAEGFYVGPILEVVQLLDLSEGFTRSHPTFDAHEFLIRLNFRDVDFPRDISGLRALIFGLRVSTCLSFSEFPTFFLSFSAAVMI